MSISRGAGARRPVGEADQLVGVLAARGKDGHDAGSGLLRGHDPLRRALDRSASATEVPPNFITTVSLPRMAWRATIAFHPARAEHGRRRLALLVAGCPGTRGAGVAGAVGVARVTTTAVRRRRRPDAGPRKGGGAHLVPGEIVPPPAWREQAGERPCCPAQGPRRSRGACPPSARSRNCSCSASGGPIRPRTSSGGCGASTSAGSAVVGATSTQTQLSALTGEAAVAPAESRHLPTWIFASQEGGDSIRSRTCRRRRLPADLRSATAAGPGALRRPPACARSA